MAKKRTSLDALFTTESASRNEAVTAAKMATEIQSVSDEEQNAANAPQKTFAASAAQPQSKNASREVVEESPAVKSKSEIVKQTVYLPAPVHEQLRQLAFEERKKMHDYLIEGLDRVFKDRGLKPFVELSNETK